MAFVRRASPRIDIDVRELVRRPAARILAGTIGLFFLGYLISASWLFPAAEDPTDARLVDVPDLHLQTTGDASSRLEGVGLRLAVGFRLNHPNAAPGTVIAQSPLGGQVARPGDSVRVTLSAGPETRVVPDLAGLGDSQASRLLRGLGFEVRVVRETGPEERAGVLRTRPPAGTRLETPARVELVVSEGAAVVEVPDLRGRHVDDVVPALEVLELQLGAIRYQLDAAAAPGRVVSQSPAAGSSLRGGGFISIVVAGTPPDSMATDLADERDVPPPATDTLPPVPPPAPGPRR